ncbi:hypothetical protein A7982_12156 [Minicystis rosea]|nr:hypothetical protein A7982_12156 [Minicystis rosea]
MNLYQLTVPQFIRVIGQAQRWLDKAEAHAAAKKFDPETLLASRLAPDMYPLLRQFQSISDTAKGNAARLAGITPPSFPDTEKTIAEIRARLQKTVEFLESLKPEQFEGAEDRTITLSFLPGKGIKGCDYIAAFGLPNFYFHATTAYDILRHNGVDVGKMDFIGAAPFFDL